MAMKTKNKSIINIPETRMVLFEKCNKFLTVEYFFVKELNKCIYLKTNLFPIENSIFFIKNNKVLFFISLNNKERRFYVNKNLWKKLNIEHNLKNEYIAKTMKIILKKHNLDVSNVVPINGGTSQGFKDDYFKRFIEKLL